MMDDIISDLLAYLDYLKTDCHLNVSVHDGGKGFLRRYMNRLAPYNIHDNPFCMAVKENRNAWDKCILQQSKVAEHCKKGAFCGMCYAGNTELVVPIEHDGQNLGFVSVSALKSDDSKSYERIVALEKRFGINSAELKKKYDENATTFYQKKDILKLIKPLRYMFIALYLTGLENTVMHDAKASSSDYVYGHIVAHINRNYASPVRLSELEDICHCSRSYISHIFRQKCGMTIPQYCNNIRVKNACKLLDTTNVTIQEIALTVGFQDANYFTNCFNKLMGVSPREYRGRNKLLQ